MHEFDKQPKSVPFDVFLLAAGENGLEALNLPDVATAIDSTYLAFGDLQLPQVDEMGFGIHDVREALAKQPVSNRNGIWGFGDTVQATVRFNLHQTGSSIAIQARAEATTDSGYEQTLVTFELTGQEFTTDELAAAAKLGQLKCNAQLFIAGPAIGHNTYEARVQQISAVQRPFDGNYEHLRQQPEFTPVMVEGTVVNYQPGQRQQHGIPLEQDPTAPIVTVRTDEGAEIVTQLSHDALLYGSSAHIVDAHATTPPHPLPGDRLRIAANWRRVYSSYSGDPSLMTVNRGSAHLLNISDERASSALRHEIALSQFTQSLARTHDPVAARRLYSTFMNTHLTTIENGELLSGFSDYDFHRIREAVTERFRYLPNTEYPISLQFSPFSIANMQKVFRTEVFPLAYKEFAELSHKIASGEHPIDVNADRDAGTVTAIYNFFQQDEATTKTLVMASLRDRYHSVNERLQNNKNSYTRHDLVWAQNALKTCADMPDLRFGAMRAAEFCQVIFESPGKTTFHAEARTAALAAMQTLLRRCGVWQDQRMREFMAPDPQHYPNPLLYLADPETFAGLQQSLETILPKINAMNEQSKVSPYYSHIADGPGTYTYQLKQIEILLAELNTKLPPQQQ
ncbi:MAG TPA: hypothetical protein VLG11_02830 [Candidatus Saccharimonadales bacterium]|nr:hypothetical protein [Candidatus Saccharimonadales bacterium]